MTSSSHLSGDSASGDSASGGVRGVLHGVGVGPGDPELLTLRAARILGEAGVIFAPASPKNEDSLALSIAAPHLRPKAEIIRLDFPMTRDAAVLGLAWKANARKVLEVLRGGRDGVFPTLGDPLIYSTFGYLMRAVLDLEADTRVLVTPGVTSFQAAAAASGTVLCEGRENLLIASGINGGEALERALQGADGAVILKTYRNAARIVEAVRASGRDGTALFASRLGLEGERLQRGCKELPDKPHYLSLLLLPPERDEDKAGDSGREGVSHES